MMRLRRGKFGGSGRVPAVEILFNTPTIREMLHDRARAMTADLSYVRFILDRVYFGEDGAE